MLRFAVVDDEINVAGQTEQCILSVCKELALEVSVDVFCSGEEILNELKYGTCFHIIFLDIEILLLVNGEHIPIAKGKRKEIAKVLI